jgi:LytS/YehU family sensor histidine kinase
VRHYVFTIVVVAAICASVIDPALVLVRRSVILALGLTGVDHSALTLPSHLRRSLINAMPVTLIMLSMWSLLWIYFHAAKRTAQALAAAQLRLAEVQRTVLAEQLQSAQAMVEPAFLFGTLSLIEQEFERDPEAAHRLLDALIRYLRAALPTSDAAGCTLGQQAELVRAYLEIERIRSGGRLGFAVELPAALQERPFAPLLVLPLVANAVRHGVASAREGMVTVRAGTQDGRLLIQVDDDGSGRCAAIREGEGLAGVRERLAALYGIGARLTLFDRVPRGVSARLELPQGEQP